MARLTIAIRPFARFPTRFGALKRLDCRGQISSINWAGD